MKTVSKCMAAVLMLLPVSPALADMQAEIRHLLDYLGTPGCEFERNGSVYDAGKARAHLERKYEHIRSRVHETEDFIRYAATGSSMTGSKYHVTCNGRRHASAGWLQAELSRYRDNPPGAAAPE
ncbi:MAG: DUF5329 family protein [Gammaproteobacteria bacterium]